MRAQQTAAALARAVETEPRVDVGATPHEVLIAAGWPEGGGTVLVVGHQPTLGQVAALALTGVHASWPIKKGAVWWVRRRVRDGALPQVVLRAVIGPDLV